MEKSYSVDVDCFYYKFLAKDVVKLSENSFRLGERVFMLPPSLSKTKEEEREEELECCLKECAQAQKKIKRTRSSRHKLYDCKDHTSDNNYKLDALEDDDASPDKSSRHSRDTPEDDMYRNFCCQC